MSREIVHCTICDREFYSSREVPWAHIQEETRVRGYCAVYHWNYYVIDSKPYCGGCLKCRSCHKLIDPKDSYVPPKGDDAIRSPLCHDCREKKATALATAFGPKSMAKTETDGTHLKSLPKLSNSFFKLLDFVELTHREKGYIIQVGWFTDYKNVKVLRVSQFHKIKSFDRKGKEKTPVFERRCIVEVKTYDLGLGHNLLTFYNAQSYIRHLVGLCRSMGYGVTCRKDHNGRSKDIFPEWRVSKAEWNKILKRDELDRHLHSLVVDDFSKTEAKYAERSKKLLSWVEEDVRRRGQ